jgi:transposase
MGVVKNKKRKGLPRDIDALLALLEESDEVLSSQRAKLTAQDEELARLRHNLRVFARMLFGQSSEKRRLTGLASGHPHQLHLFLADLLADAERVAEETGAVGHVEVERPDPKKLVPKKGRRKQFPEHVPVVESLFELPKDQLICSCGGELHAIGFEETKELERIEVTVVHKTKRTKYACRSCEEGIVTAPAPARVIDKGLLSAGFLSHVIAERFQFHMPYYRLEKKYASEGLALSRSVLERSVARCAELLEPLHDALRKEVMSKDIVFTDDTPVRIVTPGQGGGSRQARIWAYLDKEGSHYYDFTETRERDGPLSIFKDFEGFIQADAYPGYDVLFQSDDISEVACWAHVRRKFESAESSDPTLSVEALDLIGELYAVEAKARDEQLDASGTRKLRQKHALPILERIRAWLGVCEAKVLPKSPMGKAVHYAQAQWNALTIYVTDGRLEIDNNRAERAMRPIAVGRKNWLFFQTKGGGKAAAILMSLIQTAEAAGVNVKLYLRDVLQRIATESDARKLLPKGWKQHFEDDVVGRRGEIIELLLADQRGE